MTPLAATGRLASEVDDRLEKAFILDLTRLLINDARRVSFILSRE